MVLFIAPLLYLEAHEIDKSELLKSLKLSLSLAIGLAIATMVAVGVVVHAVWPSVTLAAALALGAALGPTDAVAVSSLGKEASLSLRQLGVLKGESLFNDASGIVGFQFAIAAAITGESSRSAGLPASSRFVHRRCRIRSDDWPARELAVRNRALAGLGDHHHPHIDGAVPAVHAVPDRRGTARVRHSRGGRVRPVRAVRPDRHRAERRPHQHRVVQRVGCAVVQPQRCRVHPARHAAAEGDEGASWDDPGVSNVRLSIVILLVSLVVVTMRFLWVAGMLRLARDVNTGKRRKMTGPLAQRRGDDLRRRQGHDHPVADVHHPVHRHLGRAVPPCATS